MKNSKKLPSFVGCVFYTMYFMKSGAKLIESNPADANVVVFDTGEVWLPRDYTPRLINSEPIPQTEDYSGAKRLVIKKDNQLRVMSLFHILLMAFGDESVILERQPDVFKRHYEMISRIKSKKGLQWRTSKSKSINGKKISKTKEE